jgi:gliding motility-associated protein GldM
MSIPKEPRQLMINLMYLVLTALLALNVSAEVMNAFFSLDKGMENTGKIVDRSNVSVMKSINKQADAYKNPINAKYQANATKAQEITEGFNDYIESIRAKLIAAAGGPNPKVPGQPKDIRNKDLTTRMFVKEKLGDEIQAKIIETRASLLALVDNDTSMLNALPLGIEELPEGTKTKNWVEFKFKQMPVAAVIPTLGKMQSDAKNSYSSVLGYCAKKVSGEDDVRMDSYEPVMSSKTGYIIRGEKYEADVFLSAFSSTASNVSISVNGSGLPVTQGKAHYTASGESVGTKKYNVSINVTNPITKAVKNYQKEFQYEVGERSMAVSADKMNVFYIGVDNPLSVSAAGVSSNAINVTATGCNINKTGNGKFTVTATTPTNDASINVTAGGQSQKFPFRVKRIPNPVPRLGAQHNSKQMGNGEFKAQSGIAAILENFDFEAKCDIVGFKMAYLAKRQDPVEKTNSGARYSGECTELANKAKPGDVYYFDDIRARCPGDANARELGGLVFKIK